MVLSFKALKELISQGSKFTTHGQLRYFENCQCTELISGKGTTGLQKLNFKLATMGKGSSKIPVAVIID